MQTTRAAVVLNQLRMLAHELYAESEAAPPDGERDDLTTAAGHCNRAADALSRVVDAHLQPRPVSP